MKLIRRSALAATCLMSAASMKTEIDVLPFERVDLADLSTERFLAEFSAQTPVIITNGWAEEGWRPENIADNCPHAKIRTFEFQEGSKKWGNHEQIGIMPLSEYHGKYFGDKIDRPDPTLYGFEMSLTESCPNQLENMLIPPMFLEDVFHMVTNRSGLGWPSILMGPEGSQTGMHIDTHRLPFWIAVVAPSGTDGRKDLKKFRVFPHTDLHLLKYGTRAENGNMHFEFDPWDPDYDKYPKVADGKVFEGNLRSGDLLYIPGGSPHAVKNLADNVGVSMNYLDLKTFPTFARACSAGSPLCGLVKGVGSWLVPKLQAARAHKEPQSYWKFAEIEDKADFCSVHLAKAKTSGADGSEGPGVALTTYCDGEMKTQRRAGPSIADLKKKLDEAKVQMKQAIVDDDMDAAHDAKVEKKRLEKNIAALEEAEYNSAGASQEL